MARDLVIGVTAGWHSENVQRSSSEREGLSVGTQRLDDTAVIGSSFLCPAFDPAAVWLWRRFRHCEEIHCEIDGPAAGNGIEVGILNPRLDTGRVLLRGCGLGIRVSCRVAPREEPGQFAREPLILRLGNPERPAKGMPQLLMPCVAPWLDWYEGT